MLKKLKKAFTITELVIVIAVIAILAAVLIPTFANVIENANQSAAMQTANNALKDYSSIAAMEGEADTSGVVFVSDDYVYSYINGKLQYVGKLDDLMVINSEGAISNTKNMENVSGVDIGTTESTAAKFTITLKSNADNTALATESQPKAIVISDLGEVTAAAVADDPTKTEKNDENIYIYTIEINETNYLGWFTMEVGSTDDPAEYQTQGATYSRQYGFAAVAAYNAQSPSSSTYNATFTYTA